MKNEIDWFKRLLENEISSSKEFFRDDIGKAKNETGKKRLSKIYSKDICDALHNLSDFPEEKLHDISRLIELYSSECMRYLFKRIVDGEVDDEGLINNFSFKIISENSGAETVIADNKSPNNNGESIQEWLIERFG